MDNAATVYRYVDASAVLIGPDGALALRATRAFELCGIRVIHAQGATVARGLIPANMPQMIVALAPLTADERAALADPAAAVGALLLELDPLLDDEALDALLERAAEAIVEKNLLRDESTTREDPKT